MSDYPMLISNKLHSFRNFEITKIQKYWILKTYKYTFYPHTIILSNIVNIVVYK